MATRVRCAGVTLAGFLVTAAATGLPDSTCLADTAPIAPPAYEWAAAAAHVPSSVLLAVARAESGVRLQGRWIPWPWTLNVAGVPRHFLTRAAACSTLTQALRVVSAHRIDVGLGQIDVGYYGNQVKAPCQLLDPYRNLLLAATLLKRHHEPGENWMLAIGRYHRPAGGAPAAQYRHEVAQQLARVLADAKITATSQITLP